MNVKTVRDIRKVIDSLPADMPFHLEVSTQDGIMLYFEGDEVRLYVESRCDEVNRLFLSSVIEDDKESE